MVRVPKIIFAARTILKTVKPNNTRNSLQLMPACTRSSVLMVCINHSRHLVCIAGISWTPSVLKKIFVLRYRILAGGMISGIIPRNLIYLLLFSGISVSHTQNFQSCHPKMILKFQDGNNYSAHSSLWEM